MVLHYWLIENQREFYQWITKCYGSYIEFLNLFWSNSRNHVPLFFFYFLVITKKGYSWLDPAYSWNKQLAHTPFPKKINTPSTTLRFIRFVDKISVLNPKPPADGPWPKERKESVPFFIGSPFIDRLQNWIEFFLYDFVPLFYLFFYFHFPFSILKSIRVMWTTNT